MVIATFDVKNKKNKSYFFEKTFLFAKLSINIVDRILFVPFKQCENEFLKTKNLLENLRSHENYSYNKKSQICKKKTVSNGSF